MPATINAADVATQVARGARAMRAPTLAQRPIAVWSTDPKVGCTGQKSHRPTMTRRVGNSVGMTMSPTAIPTAANRAQALGGVHARDQQAQHAGDHRGTAGEDRGTHPVQRKGPRLVPVLVSAQLLPVAGDQQQGIVGTGPEDQNRQDAGTVRVDREAIGGE